MLEHGKDSGHEFTQVPVMAGAVWMTEARRIVEAWRRAYVSAVSRIIH